MLKVFTTFIISLAVFAVWSSKANAGTIINRPLYLGLTQGLVGYWSFDGPDMSGNTAYDRSPGNANNGTLTNGPVRAIGKLGQGLSFDGINDYVTMADNSVLDGGTIFGISFWVNQTDLDDGSSRALVTKWTHGSQDSWFIQNPGSDDSIRFYVASSLTDTGSNYGNTPTGLLNKGWHHVVATFDGSGSGDAGRMQIYVDGVQRLLTFVGTIPAVMQDSTAPMEIATNTSINTQYYGALIDDVRIYNRALSPNEIRRLYQIGSTTKINATPKYLLRDSSLVGYWTFNATETGTTSAMEITRDTDKTAYLKNGAHYTPGTLGQGVEFDGVDDYMSAPADDDLNLITHETISAWIYKRSNNGFDQIMRKWYDLGSTYFAEFATSGTELQYTPGGGADTNHVTSGLNLQTGQWYHVAAVHDDTNNRAKIYLNGVEVKNASETQAGGQGPASAVGELYIGSDQVPGSFFDGKIDDLRIYTRPLSPDEIKRLYRIGAPTKINATPKHQLTNGLVGYWSFDGPDMSGNTAYDRSPGNTNNGTLTNGPVRAIGKLGQALDFDGADDLVDFGSGNAINTALNGNFTYAAWIKNDDLGSGMLFGARGPLNSRVIAMGIWAANQINITEENVSAFGGRSFTTINQWRHIAWTYEGGIHRLYFDGVQQGDTISYTFAANYSGSNFIGVASSETFDGLIDDVRIYNRALSPDEVRRLYQMGR